MTLKQNPQRSHDFEAHADEAFHAAQEMPPGPERIEALKAAGRLRNSADAYGLIFANATVSRSEPLRQRD
jgi:hypothetical protein